MNERTKSVLEKAKRERNEVNNVMEAEASTNKEKETEDENMGLNIQTQSTRNQRQTDREEQRKALSLLSQQTNPRQSRSQTLYAGYLCSFLVLKFKFN